MKVKHENPEELKKYIDTFLGVLMDRLDPLEVYLTGDRTGKPVIIYNTEPSTPGVRIFFLENGEKESCTAISKDDFHEWFKVHK